MVVKIRLARFGRRNDPFYNIVVAQARCARNSKPMEVLGTYDPVPKRDIYDPSGRLHKDIQLDITRTKYWVGVGAQPSDTARRIFSLVGIMDPKYPKLNPVEERAKEREFARKWQSIRDKRAYHASLPREVEEEEEEEEEEEKEEEDDDEEEFEEEGEETGRGRRGV